MSLAATLAMTVGGVAKTLTRIGGDLQESRYYCQEALVRYEMTIRQGRQSLKRSDGSKQSSRRVSAELICRTFATSTTPEDVDFCYMAVAKSDSNYSVTVPTALCGVLTASSSAVLIQLAAGET